MNSPNTHSGCEEPGLPGQGWQGLPMMAVCGAERPRISFPSRFMNPPRRRTMEALHRRRRVAWRSPAACQAAKRRTPGTCGAAPFRMPNLPVLSRMPRSSEPHITECPGPCHRGTERGMGGIYNPRRQTPSGADDAAGAAFQVLYRRFTRPLLRPASDKSARTKHRPSSEHLTHNSL